MSADKQTRASNRYEDYRSFRNQLSIWKMYNRNDYWLPQQKPTGWRKRKAMNCSCKTCRGWAKDARQHRYDYQLEKSGMKTKEWTDERPDI
jgi:hypothetical protein